jgi:hypothetical protein
VIKNILACLVFEKPEIVWDMVRNLRRLDPHSVVLIYNNSGDRNLLRGGPFASDPKVVLCPVMPRPKLVYGVFHEFMIDCMRWSLDHLEFDTITNVDSDQMLLRRGLSEALTHVLEQHPKFGMLSSPPSSSSWPTHLPFNPTHINYPQETAWAELHDWMPFLSQWVGGVSMFDTWTFWPATTFGREASRGIVRLFDSDPFLRRALNGSRIFATEEVVLPVLVRLLGFEIVKTPFNFDSVRFQPNFGVDDLTRFLACEQNVWIHTVRREMDDPIRARIRLAHGNYERGTL